MATPASAVSDERFHEIDLPPVPEYESTEQAALDAALVTAMERAEAADETVLVPWLRSDVGSMRYKVTLGGKPRFAVLTILVLVDCVLSTDNLQRVVVSTLLREICRGLTSKPSAT